MIYRSKSIITLLGAVSLIGLSSFAIASPALLNSPASFTYAGTDAKTGTSVTLVVHMGVAGKIPYNRSLVVDSFKVSNGKCTINDTLGTIGQVSTFSVNSLPFGWQDKYGKVSGSFNLPTSYFGPSTIKWQQLNGANCTIAALQMNIKSV